MMRTTVYSRFLRVVLVIMLGAAIPACDTTGLSMLPASAIGIGGGVRSLMHAPTSVGGVISDVATVMAIVATVKFYCDLNAAQKQRVERVVQERYQQKVEAEKRALASKYAARRAEIQKRSQAKVTTTTGAKPGPQGNREVVAMQADAKRELENVDKEWHDAAVANVKSKYGNNFAVPLTNPDGKQVVAFASIKDDQVQVASSAYEVGGKVGEGSKVKHDGQTYAVVNEPVGL